MNYFLTDDQKMIKDLAAQIAREKIAPIAAELDESGEFPWEVVKTLAQSDLFRVFIPTEYDGLGGGMFEMCLVVEELSRACSGIALAYAASGLGTIPIILFGNEEQKKKYLPRLAAGEILAAFGLTESGAGSDAAAIKTTAKPDGDCYVINGTKQWITNGGEASIYTVVALTDPVRGVRGSSTILVEKGHPGFTFGKKENKMGIRASATRELVFQDCRVPKTNLLAKEGMGFLVAMKTLDQSRPGVASQALGIAQGAMDQADRVLARAQAVRQADLRLPGHPVHARRHGHPGGGGARPDLRGGAQHRRGREGRVAAVGHGQGVRLRHRDEGDHGRGAGARRLRLHEGLPGGEDDAGREDHPDLRGHQPDPARSHRPRPHQGKRPREEMRGLP